ncbi:Sin-like protein conserved region-domain-containing protein [Favolaschia claudopus]|uniref:Sin-like protein conserved region-domain-containing protein n=1 Tax=Favolaschia claudopus TaxID=2862362 RepID=A0AAW0EI77_9AGAR
MDIDDEIVSRIPIRFSDSLSPKIHIHQFPLLTRPLQVPPSAAASGKRITARVKPAVQRLEVHVPSDTRTEVWNSERGKDLGTARVEDDREKNQELKNKGRENEEPRLSEVRMRSEQIQQQGAHMLGIVRDGQLHLHPISETHQLRPTLTYLDILSRKNKRSRGGGSDSDSDDGPPPDPDEPAPPPVSKKEKKPAGEAREVQVTARKADDKAGVPQIQGGVSVARREMLAAIHAEEDASWQDLDFYDVTVRSTQFNAYTFLLTSATTFEGIFSQSDVILETRTDVTTFLKDISGL